MKERISALMDGELAETEIGPCLNGLQSDQGYRRVWDAYHLIGDALRGNPDCDIAAVVSRRMESEPTVIAPPRRRASTGRMARVALSAAAGVAAVVLVAWMALPRIQGEPVPVASGVPGGPVAPIASAPATVAPVSAGVENYLLAHQRFSPAIAMQGVATYVRTVADERGR